MRLVFGCILLLLTSGALATTPTFHEWTPSSEADGNVTSHTITYPSTINTNDLLVAVFGSDGNESVNQWEEEGWTVLDDSRWDLNDHSTGQVTSHLAYYYNPPGAEAGTTFEITTGTGERSGAVIARISGATNPATSAIEFTVTGSNGTPSTSPDPGSITPSHGLADYLYLWVVVNDVGTVSASGFPTGYINTGNNSIDGPAGTNLAYGTKATTASSSEDPDAGTLTSSEEWIAYVIAVHAASGGGDSTAPTFGTVPEVHSTAYTSVTADATASDETDATVSHYGLLLTDGATYPASGTQCKAWFDTGAGSNNVVAIGSDLGVSNGAEGSITFAGLTYNTSYDLAYCVGDSSGNYVLHTKIDTATNADATAPSFSQVPAIDGTTATTITTDATASDDRDTTYDFYVLVLTDAATYPANAAQAKTWYDTGAGSNNVVAICTDADVANTTEASAVCTGLTASTAYDVAGFAGDADDNYVLHTKLDATTAASDSTPPVLTNADISDFQVGTADLLVDTDEGNGTLYCVVTDSATQPSIAQIKAGNDHTGSAAEAAPTPITVVGTGTQTFNNVSISAGYWYNHCVHTDAAANDSNRLSSVQFRVAGDSDGPTDWFGLAITPVGDHVFPAETAANDPYFVERQSGTITDVLSNGNVSGGSAEYSLESQIWDESTPALSSIRTVVYDALAPTVSTLTINADGDVLTIVWSEACDLGVGGSDGLTLSAGGHPVTLGTLSGEGTDTWVYSLSPVVYQGEVVTLDHTNPGDGIEDSAAGNDLANFSGSSVTNNSTVPAPASAGDCPAVLPNPTLEPIKSPLRQPLCAS